MSFKSHALLGRGRSHEPGSKGAEPGRIAWAASLLIAVAAVALTSPAFASVKSEIAFHRGVVAFGDGDYAAARTAFETVVSEDPDDSAAIHYLGLIASEQGDPAAAVDYYRRALAIDPEDTDVRFDLGSALLESGQTNDARAEFDAVLAVEPDRANAQLLAGIAAYRAADYRAALPYLDRAVELDPEVRSQARYYTGLSQAHLQDFPAAAGAFADAEQSPLSPLADSARNLGQQVADSQRPERRAWNVALTAGLEFDSNPTLAGETLNQKADGRGVYRARGSYDLYQKGRYSFTAGYDGYWSTNFDQTFVDLQTHVGYLTANADFDPIRLGIRYDFAYTFIDMSHKFRTLNRVTPSFSYREENWGLKQIYFQYTNQDFHFSIPTGFNAIDRDGDRYTVGFNQFLFLREHLPAYLPFNYFRIGAAGDFMDTEGTEFDYDAWEFSFGFGAELPFEMPLTVFYRLMNRHYRNNSIFAGTDPSDSVPEKQDALENRLSFELDVTQPVLGGLARALSGNARTIVENFQLSIAGSFTFNGSDVGLYDYNREVVGSYVTYRF